MAITTKTYAWYDGEKRIGEHPDMRRAVAAARVAATQLNKSLQLVIENRTIQFVSAIPPQEQDR